MKRNKMTSDQLQKIRQLLKSLEWIHVAFYEDDFFCPSCKRSKESGHYKDCQLKQALTLLPCETCNGTKKTVKEILSDAFTEYRQAYRNNETDETSLFPRNKYPDVVSYQAAKIIESFNMEL